MFRVTCFFLYRNSIFFRALCVSVSHNMRKMSWVFWNSLKGGRGRGKKEAPLNLHHHPILCQSKRVPLYSWRSFPRGCMPRYNHPCHSNIPSNDLYYVPYHTTARNECQLSKLAFFFFSSFFGVKIFIWNVFMERKQSLSKRETREGISSVTCDGLCC